MSEVELLASQVKTNEKQSLDVTGKYTKLLVDYEWVSGQH